MFAKVTTIQVTTNSYAGLFPFFVYFPRAVPAIDILSKYRLHRLLSRKQPYLRPQEAVCETLCSKQSDPLHPGHPPPLLSLVSPSTPLLKVMNLRQLLVEIPHQSLFFLRAQIQLFSGSAKGSNTGRAAVKSLPDALRCSLTEEKR